MKVSGGTAPFAVLVRSTAEVGRSTSPAGCRADGPRSLPFDRFLEEVEGQFEPSETRGATVIGSVMLDCLTLTSSDGGKEDCLVVSNRTPIEVRQFKEANVDRQAEDLFHLLRSESSFPLAYVLHICLTPVLGRTVATDDECIGWA